MMPSITSKAIHLAVICYGWRGIARRLTQTMLRWHADAIFTTNLGVFCPAGRRSRLGGKNPVVPALSERPWNTSKSTISFSRYQAIVSRANT